MNSGKTERKERWKGVRRDEVQRGLGRNRRGRLMDGRKEGMEPNRRNGKRKTRKGKQRMEVTDNSTDSYLDHQSFIQPFLSCVKLKRSNRVTATKGIRESWV